MAGKVATGKTVPFVRPLGPEPPDAVDEAAAARLLSFKESTLKKWRRKGLGPPYIRHGRAIRYRLRDLNAWLDSHVVIPEDDTPPKE